MTTGVLWALGGFGPDQPHLAVRPSTSPYKISYAVQTDWYMGWLDGALRIMPPISWMRCWGHTVPLVVFFPPVLFPGICSTFFYM